jgi:ribonuclease P/MRP protein subunit RPP40
VIHEWKQELENGKIILCVFLDLKRAFETIDRNMMMHKLKIQGFSDDTLKWFENYHMDRKQQTKISSSLSSQISCDLGVPQGEVLPPIMFVLYINDIVDVVKNVKINLFETTHYYGLLVILWKKLLEI